MPEARGRVLRHLPNAITLLRIAATPVLAAMAHEGARRAFAVLLVASLLGDILDGLLARRLGVASALGAALDSTADMLLFYAAAYGVWVFHPQLLEEHAVALLSVPVLGLAEHLLALARYRRLSSFHTLLSRVAAYALGIFLGVLFVWGFSPVLMGVAVTLFALATAEECALLALLPAWTPDVRGLYWVLRARRTAA